MKSHTEYVTFSLPVRMAFENITPKIEEIVQKSGVREGLLLCNAMHSIGPWEQKFHGEFGGRRFKRMLINAIRE